MPRSGLRSVAPSVRPVWSSASSIAGSMSASPVPRHCNTRTEPGSSAVFPSTASITSASSRTVGVSSPGASRVGLSPVKPRVGHAPTGATYPATPQNEAGLVSDPAVCDPRARGTTPAATAAAEPLEEPPGVWAGRCGLRVGPGWKYANSVVTVLPSGTAPARRSRSTSQASSATIRPWRSTEPHSVGNPATSMMSLTPNGMPRKGLPSGARRAALRAPWASTHTQARISGSVRSRRASARSTR